MNTVTEAMKRMSTMTHLHQTSGFEGNFGFFFLTGFFSLGHHDIDEDEYYYAGDEQ